MMASSDSVLAKTIQIGTIITFTLITLGALGRFIYYPNDRTRCSSLLNEGWWADDSLKSWQPASCTLHNYKPTEISQCLSHSRIVYVGDSIVRQQFFATIQLIRPDVNTTTDVPHVNRKFVFEEEGLTFEFWWDPYLNDTTTTLPLLTGSSPSLKPSLLVIGSGTWQMRYLEKEDYFFSWKNQIDVVFNSIEEKNDIADAVMLNPVVVPVYSVLAKERSDTMTLDKVNKMNEYLLQRQSDLMDSNSAKQQFEIPFVWNKIGLSANNVTEDGLHYNTAVTHMQAQIALNYRCNDQVLSKKFPLDTTCCYTYPFPRWYQVFFFVLFLVWTPVGYFVMTALDLKYVSFKVFPSKSVLDALFVFGLCVMYMYFGDRTHLFGKINKNFNPAIFTGMMVAIAIMGMAKLTTNKKEGADQGFLNRHQTDEWKGWMQVIILVYHFCGASSTSGIYNAVRILVAAYLFQTGYGHFFFFYKKADFGLGRVLNVMVRLNILTFVLQYLMDTDYLSYYFTPLVSFWFLAIWVIMYVGHSYNKIPAFMLGKMVLGCCATTTIIKMPGILEFVFFLLERVFNVHWNAEEWRFRLKLDAYIVYVGMLCAYCFIKITEHKLTHHPRWFSVKIVTLILSAVAMVWYFWYELTRQDKFVYNYAHPYISWIPILAFIILRNANVYLRNTHSEFFSFIGKISLETFIGQFHMWLAGDTKALLVILPDPKWVQGFGWWINFAISSCLFIFVSYYTSQSTQQISTWICQHAASESMSKNNTSPEQQQYQAVQLLPTSTTFANKKLTDTSIKEDDKSSPEVVVNSDVRVHDTTVIASASNNHKDNEHEVDDNEEIWDSSLANEKKPNLLKQLLDDTRVKILLFFVIVGVLNNLQ